MEEHSKGSFDILDQYTDEQLEEGLRALRRFKAAPPEIQRQMLEILGLPLDDEEQQQIDTGMND